MKNILILLFFLGCQFTFSQNQPVSIEFNNKPLNEVLKEIEKKTSYRFYYLENWLTDYTVTGKYENAALNYLLEDILKNTVLNFYLHDGEKVILTKNNIIYEDLPENFFGTSAVEEDNQIREDKTVKEPVFVKPENKLSPVETVVIGKESADSYGKIFTLSGYVRSQENNEALGNVSLLIPEINFGTTTNDNGYYEIKLPAGTYLLESSSLETRSLKKRIVLFNNGQLDLQLEESLEQLGEVVLQAKGSSNLKRAITGVEQINVKEIKTIPLVLGERDILKVATTLPGISTAGEGAAGYNVRGGRADQNLILLDGAVIYNPSHFFGIFSALNPFTTGEVDIYKGTIPAEFGGRLSSVFDIKTKNANTQKFSGEASIGPVTSSLALEIPVVEDKSGLIIGGRSTYSDWILRSLEEESLQNTKASFYDVVAKYHHQFNENNDLETTGYYSRDVFSITSDSLFSYSNRLASLRFNHRFNEKNRGSILLSNSNYEFNIDYDGNFNSNFTSGYNINETEIKLNLNYLYSEKHNFNYGVSGKMYVVNPGRIRPEGENSIVQPMDIAAEKGLETAVYLADDFTVNQKLLINAGIRYSFYSSLGPGVQTIYEAGAPKSEAAIVERIEYGNNEFMHTYGGPEFRTSARYLLGREFSTKLSYNSTYQYIHTLSNTTTISPTDTYKLSDNNIKPQRANQYSLGLYKNFENNMYETSVEGYYRTSSNMLDFKVGAQLFLNENIETEVLQGEGRAHGVEFLVKKTEGKLNGWVGYSYSRSLIKLDSEFREERVNGGEYFPANFDKPHDFSFVGNYKLTKRFSFSANLIYQTGRPVTFPIGKYTFNGNEYVLYSDRNQYRIPDYYRLDLSFNVEGNHRIKKLAHSFWNVSVYNVLGRNNPYSVFFVTEGGEVKAYQSSIFAIPVPTITYNFRF